MEDIDKYIVSIGVCKDDGTFERHGYGVLIGRRIFTAGHVTRYVNDRYHLYEARFKGESHGLILNHINVEYYCFDENFKNTEHLDIAVFNLDKRSSFLSLQKLPEVSADICSPLLKAKKEPEIGEVLTVVNFEKHIERKVVSKKGVFDGVERDLIGRVYGTIEQEWTTVFSTDSDGNLGHGDSGSPIMRENEVVGILIMGTEKGMVEKDNGYIELEDNVLFMKMSELIIQE